MKRVTGLGGVFFKAQDPANMKLWYENHLGITGVFKWKDLAEPDAKAPAQTIWSPFKNDTAYFNPSDKPFMLNFRVANLEELLKVLRDEGIQALGEVQSYPYGKFGWIMDPEGNKIELWEPVDDTF